MAAGIPYLGDWADLIASQAYDPTQTAASVPATVTGTSTGAVSSGAPGVGTLLQSGGGGANIGNLIGQLFGLNPSSAGATGSEIGTGIGALAGSFIPIPGVGTLLGALAGGALGDVFGNLVGGGIPQTAKTTALGQAFGASGNPIDALLAKFIQRGVGQGDVLSQSGGSTFEGALQRLGAMLEALTGQKGATVTATGFQNNPTYGPKPLGFAADKYQLPAGYEFVQDPSKLQQIYKDLLPIIGMSAPGFGAGAGSQEEWKRIVNELISQGTLQKYGGPLGAVGAGPTSAGAIPNISLPHPLAQNTGKFAPPPYPV